MEPISKVEAWMTDFVVCPACEGTGHHGSEFCPQCCGDGMVAKPPSLFQRAWDWAWPAWRWLTPGWWRGLLDGCTGWRNFWCRVRCHPYGVVWYSQYRDEPDMRCKNCREDLG